MTSTVATVALVSPAEKNEYGTEDDCDRPDYGPGSGNAGRVLGRLSFDALHGDDHENSRQRHNYADEESFPTNHRSPPLRRSGLVVEEALQPFLGPPNDVGRHEAPRAARTTHGAEAQGMQAGSPFLRPRETPSDVHVAAVWAASPPRRGFFHFTRLTRVEYSLPSPGRVNVPNRRGN